MTDGAGAPRRYLAFLLRLQAIGGTGEALIWQASLEAPRTHSGVPLPTWKAWSRICKPNWGVRQDRPWRHKRPT